MIEELSKLDEELGQSGLSPLIGGVLHALANLSTRWQFAGGVMNGSIARSGKSVVIFRRQNAAIRAEGRAPKRIPQVVARSVQGSVFGLVLT